MIEAAGDSGARELAYAAELACATEIAYAAELSETVDWLK
jgi:hypothetical protein